MLSSVQIKTVAADAQGLKQTLRKKTSIVSLRVFIFCNILLVAKPTTQVLELILVGR